MASQAATLTVLATGQPVLGPTGHYYEVVEDWDQSWPTAEAKARDRIYRGVKGHLATLTSAQEDAFVQSLLVDWYAGQEFWVGGFQNPITETDPLRGWTWVNNDGPIPGSNSGPGYARWLDGESNDFGGPASEQYLAINHYETDWNDEQSIGAIYGYVVEYDMGTPITPVVIITHPQSQGIAQGLSVTLQVTVSGTPPISFQWKFNGENIPGATNASHTISRMDLAQAGEYTVEVSNAMSQVLSQPALVLRLPAIEWQQSYGGISGDERIGLDTVADGGYVLGGQSWSPASGNKTAEFWGSMDFWVVRIDDRGQRLWDRSFGGNEDDYLHDVLALKDGGFLLAGSSRSSALGNKTTLNHGDFDYWVIRLNTNGNVMWERTLGGTGRDMLYACRQTPDGGFILGGNSCSPASGTKRSVNHGDYDYWLVRLDAVGAVGNLVWDVALGGTSMDWLAGRLPAGYVYRLPTEAGRELSMRGEC